MAAATECTRVLDMPAWDKKGYAGLDNWISQQDKAVIAGGIGQEKRQQVLTELLDTGLTNIFGSDCAEELSVKILAGIDRLNIPQEKLIPEVSHQLENTLVVYPGTFGGFEGLAQVIPAIADLGVTQVHILPLYEQGGDEGFSVKNYELERPLKIAQKWGGEEKLALAIVEAKKHGIKMMFDAVINHIDITSPVFDQVGVEALTMYFEPGREPFRLLRVDSDPTGGQYAVYEHNGNEVKHLIIFPEQAQIGKIEPQLVNVDGVNVWTTFYPFQLDLDLNKPKAFELATNTLLQLCGLLGGEGTIRLDAIPFIGKQINAEKFEYMDSDRGYQLISLMRLVTALAAPRVKLLAEAARPLNEMMQYPERVGNGYDFYALPMYMEALLTENSTGFVEAIQHELDVIGLADLKKLAVILQTHDDNPIQAKDEATIAKLWKLLEGKGALPFGDDGKGSIPRAAVIRLFEICDKNPDKFLTAIALASMLPHGRLLWLYGTEIAAISSQENLAKDEVLAKQEGRKVEKRAFIRQPMEVDKYLAELKSDLSQRFGKIIKDRIEKMPEEITKYIIEGLNGGTVVKIEIAGKTSGKAKMVSGLFNLSSSEQKVGDSTLMPYTYQVN